MADSQDIEAKLAAYVDGELPPDQRAEIEKYLSANPQQRRLIADLMRQRDVLRDLPKVAAPGDVSETLNSQLERSVLLDGPEGPDVAGTIRPWRSVAAVAATILLVSALGLTIYSLLPSPTRKPPDLATMQTVPASRPVSEGGITLDSFAPTTLPALSEQETRARSALAARDERQADSSLTPIAERATSVAAGNGTAASIDAPLPQTVNPVALATPGPSTAPATETPVGQSIEIATTDALATRRQLVSTLTALGATVQSATTEPTEGFALADNRVVLQIPQRDMVQAVKVAQSFQIVAEPSLSKTSLKDATTQPAQMTTESNLGNLQSQSNQSMVAPAAIEPEVLPPTTQPLEVVTVRLLPIVEVPPATGPSTIPATGPTSIPATEPTTSP